MGRFLALALPDWGFSLRGTRYTLNPGPWSAKEQLFATIISQADSIGNFTGLLVMRLPIFFNQRWAGFGFAILLALANQIFGLGMAGILRRLTVYPQEAVWPSVLPTLALNRTLINSDNQREVVNGWKITRFRCFAIASVVFLIYYWIPNEFFAALRLFNWMTWISPNNKNLAIVTGSYGGMGFNPWSSFDPNLSGSSAMNAPFFAQLQQYVMRAIAGVIILIMYYTNASWAGYMPINSNTAFNNKMVEYNVSTVLNANNTVNIDQYKAYGPPYYAIANLFVTGGNFVYYTFSIVYVFIKYWGPLKKAFVGIVVNTIKRRSIYTGFSDGQTTMIRRYKEVPEWWVRISPPLPPLYPSFAAHSIFFFFLLLTDHVFFFFVDSNSNLWTVLHRFYIRFCHIRSRRDCVADANTLVVDHRRRRNRCRAHHPLGCYSVYCHNGHLVKRDLAGAPRRHVARPSTPAAGHPYAWWCLRAAGWRLYSRPQVRTLR
jgi:hypothetical protein